MNVSFYKSSLGAYTCGLMDTPSNIDERRMGAYILSLLRMDDYKTTRLLICCALDRIWSSTQRLKDLDWFEPEMPYVQYEGGVLALLLSSPSAQSSEGSLQTFRAVILSESNL